MTFSFLFYQKKNEEIITGFQVAAAQERMYHMDYRRPPMIKMCNDVDTALVNGNTIAIHYT